MEVQEGQTAENSEYSNKLRQASLEVRQTIQLQAVEITLIVLKIFHSNKGKTD